MRRLLLASFISAALSALPGPLHASEAEQARSVYQTLLAQVAEQRGENEIALANALAAAESTGEAALARQAFILAQKLQKREEAARAGLLWATAEPDNGDAQAAAALASLQIGNIETALPRIQRLLELVGDAPDARVRQLHRLTHVLPPGLAVHVLGELAKTMTDPETAWLVSAMAAQRGEDSVLAMGMADNALDKRPDWGLAVAVKADLLTARGDAGEAIDWLQQALTRQPKAADLQKALGRLLYQQGRYGEAAQQFAPLAAAKPDERELHYLLALSRLLSGDPAQALPAFQKLRAEGHQAPLSAYLCGLAAERLDQIATALECFDAVDGGNNRIAAARAAARIRTDHGDLPAALAGLDQLAATLDGNEQAGLQTYALQLLHDAGRHTDLAARLATLTPEQGARPALRFWQLRQQHAAPDALLAALIGELPDSAEGRKEWAFTLSQQFSNLQAHEHAFRLLDHVQQLLPEDLDLRYTRALLAEGAGHTELAIAGLRDVLARDANHVDALNALGFTLADHQQQLDEAEDLVRRAHEQRPGSAAITDSLGWVLYRKGDLKQALTYLKRAWQQEPEAEIASHYGEALWQSGDRKTARQVWQAAHKRHPGDAKLNAVLARYKPW